jgi:TonB-dependent receptor
LIAQEVNKAVSERNNEPTEIIEVSGVRASLENALNVKRGAASIVDAISANDIDALPALDFGEALQAIPGVQLNTAEEGRQSQISLRGLGSGFVKTTAFGQSFATPSGQAGVSAVGSPNPFSAFESGIFDGVTVVKSPTADLQAGGVAGIVDKQLQQALSKKDGTFTASVGGRYEELTENWDPSVRLSGVKHLIDDKLAVAFKFSGSGQTFRRDTFDIIDYLDTQDRNFGLRARGGRPGSANRIELPAGVYPRATNIAEYRAAHNIPENAIVSAPIRGRNVSEFSDGQRVSFSGNIEYRITDDLKVGAHLLFSERDLDDGTKEETSFGPGWNARRDDRDALDTSITIDLDTAPVLYDTSVVNGEVVPVFAATRFDFENGTLQNTNRKTTFREKSEGLIAYADYVKDDWLFDGVITHSKASNEFSNTGIGLSHNQDWSDIPRLVDDQGARTRLPAVPTGFNGTLDNGRGNLDDIVVQGAFDTPYVYDNLRWTPGVINGATITSIDPQNQGRRLQLALTGRVRDLSRELNSFEFNSQRYTDFGFGDFLRFDSIKGGFRYSVEDLESVDVTIGPGGINTGNIGSELITDQVLSSVQGPYFGGNIPGTFDNTNGWQTIINDLAISRLQEGLPENAADVGTSNSSAVSDLTVLSRTGFFGRQNTNDGLPLNLAFNFEAEQAISALYFTTDFSGEFGDIAYTGNFGVRHVRTENEFDGLQTDVDNNGQNGSITPLNTKDDYNNTLPMLNVSFELSDDVVLRTAYYEGIVRPNLLSQRPAASVRGGNTNVTLTLPGATVRPYESTSYDVSLEWYNREGSAISLGFFQKDITNLFDEVRGNCPAPGENATVDALLGDLRVVPGANIGEFGCEQVRVTVDTDGNEDNREVTLVQPINIDGNLHVEGFELAIQQNLDFLPYPWNGFGGVFNYTKLRQSGDIEIDRISPESFNLIGYWENDGISLRLAYNWRDDLRVRGQNSFLGTNVRTREAIGRLDFVGSYKLNKKAKVFLRAFNLTDEYGLEHLGDNREAVARLTYTGRIYEVSLNYRF